MTWSHAPEGYVSRYQCKLIAMSTKQKLNTTSSTEAGLVCVCVCVWAIVCPLTCANTGNLFLQGGIRMFCIRIMSRVSNLQTLEKAFSSKWTRHIYIRYFFDIDQVEKKELEIHYCPSMERLVYFFTRKPLQGALFTLFTKFWNSILVNRRHILYLLLFVWSLWISETWMSIHDYISHQWITWVIITYLSSLWIWDLYVK